jgi:uncharacterized damage-inducible protein DinB
VAADVSRLLLRELEAYRREIELFPDDRSVWTTVPGVTNSAGNLVLHVCASLRHYFGTVLGGAGYRRDRDAEFGRRSGTRRELVDEVEAAIAAVRAGAAALTPEALEAAFPEAVLGVRPRTGVWVVHLVAHTAFHLGQVGYLRRIVTGDPQSSGALPLGPLAD